MSDVMTLLNEIKQKVESLELKTAEFMDTDQAARFLSISTSTLNKLSCPSNMVIPVAQFGGKKKIFMRKDLIQFIENNKSTPIAQ